MVCGGRSVWVLNDRIWRGLQKSEEACKQYKKWLKAMAEYARAMLGAKQAVQAAEEEAKGREEDLSMFLEQADTFLLAREKHRRRRSDKDKETCAPPSTFPLPFHATPLIHHTIG